MSTPRQAPTVIQPSRTKMITSQQAAVVGANIRVLRQGRGWSQARLAELMGWNAASTVCAAEGHRDGRQRGFTIEEVRRLAAIFGIPVWQLTTRCANCDGHPPAGFSCRACGAAGSAGGHPARPAAWRLPRSVWHQFATAAAIRERMRELAMSSDDLADRAGLSWGDMKYFGVLPHDPAELERVSVALDWPPGHLQALWNPHS